MTCISLAKYTCDAIDVRYINFFWGTNGETNSMYLEKKETLFMDTKIVGLAFV